MSTRPLRPLAFAALSSALALGLSACGSETSASSAATPPASAQTTQLRESDYVLGDPDAPVTVIEYASLGCGHCGTFHRFVLPDLKEKYVDTGKVRFVFREYPTGDQKLFWFGGRLAECAAGRSSDEDKGYFAVIDAIFATHEKLFTRPEPGTEPPTVNGALAQVANEAGFSESEYKSCLAAVDEDYIAARQTVYEQDRELYGITGTPAFIIDGVLRSDLGSVSSFEAAFDEKIAAAEG